ncbi:MAG: ATP-binding protein [Alphaproteobacteria bacterium]|nr:ATP-binding protein [Alphaproteobacteria bacterium]
MTAEKLHGAAVGLPRFAIDAALGLAPEQVQPFDLSSHQRAREALEFGLALQESGYNIFVLGQERAGRMTATLRFLANHVDKKPPSPDWVYLNNFPRPNKPKPYQLPAGSGRALRDGLRDTLPAITSALREAFANQSYTDAVERENARNSTQASEVFQQLRARAQTFGLDAQRTEQGFTLVVIGPTGEPLHPSHLGELTPEARGRIERAAEELSPAMVQLNRTIQEGNREFAERLGELNRRIADETIAPLMDSLERDYSHHAGLRRWLIGMRADIIDNLMLFRTPPEGEEKSERELDRNDPAIRYGVNLITDNSENPHPSVVLEPNPTYENLFGTIQYRSVQGTLETDFTMIRPGALHRANGGVLVLRAEAVAVKPMVWDYLKAAIRDREIRIEELHRFGAVPTVGVPSPKPIPLEVKIVLVGAPEWYYHYSGDRDFRALFKIKAEIDVHMDATPENVATYAKLIRHSSHLTGGIECAPAAIERLLGYTSRMAADREKLASRYEMVEDVLIEAKALIARKGQSRIEADDVRAVFADRRRRNARTEDAILEQIRRGQIMIATSGTATGQVNALSVRDTGDHAFGAPSRITARVFVGQHGVINIERVTELGGQLQHKGVMILQGFLNGLFARAFPLSFSCSVTFEQNYGLVEGDSASQAELYGVLSALAEVPLRQDVAVTGSVNQMGEAQAVGGVNEKVEGYYRACNERGLTGTQGVIVPQVNARNLTLREEVSEAIAAGRFHLWTVTNVAEGIELLSGMPAGEADAEGAFPAASVFGRVQARLKAFDKILAERRMTAG